MQRNLLTLFTIAMLLAVTLTLKLKTLAEDDFCGIDATWLADDAPDPVYTLEKACTKITDDFS